MTRILRPPGDPGSADDTAGFDLGVACVPGPGGRGAGAAARPALSPTRSGAAARATTSTSTRHPSRAERRRTPDGRSIRTGTPRSAARTHRADQLRRPREQRQAWCCVSWSTRGPRPARRDPFPARPGGHVPFGRRGTRPFPRGHRRERGHRGSGHRGTGQARDDGGRSPAWDRVEAVTIRYQVFPSVLMRLVDLGVYGVRVEVGAPPRWPGSRGPLTQAPDKHRTDRTAVQHPH